VPSKVAKIYSFAIEQHKHSLYEKIILKAKKSSKPGVVSINIIIFQPVLG